MSRSPRRGDVLRMNFDPQLGHEQGGFRPAVVVSQTLYNENSSTVVVCPVTSNVGVWPFKVELPQGFSIRGAVLVDQLKVVDWRARRARFAATCPSDVLEQIDGKLDILFKGFSRPAGIG